MAHARNTIRDAVVAALTDGTTGITTIESNRVNPFTVLPAVNVLTLDEDVRNDLSVMNGISEQIRELHLVVEGVVESSDPEDDLDDIAEEVEEVILNDTGLNDLALDLVLESTEFSYSRDGRYPIGKAEIYFAFLYQTDGLDPSSILA